MTAALTLWGHALSALLFAVVALRAYRSGWPGRAFVGAAVLSALWALAVAGIGPADLSARLVGAGRDLAWIGFAFTLVRRDRAGSWTLGAVYLVVAAVVLGVAGLALAEAVTRSGPVRAELAAARAVFGMMAAAGALVLAQHLYGAAPGRGHRVRPIAAALAGLWGIELVASAAAWAHGPVGALWAARGLAGAGVAVLLGLAAQRREGRTLALSRPAATRALIAVALVVYGGLVACLAAAAGAWGGEHARALQVGVVTGAAAALLTLASTSWLGAWAKVKLAKHLFRHRYDYRVEWQRFTETLGQAGEPLEMRVVAAVARILDAPAGLLLAPVGAGLTTAAVWRWEAGGEGGAALVDHLSGGRIVELDAVRAGDAPDDAAAVPGWMMAHADAWVLVPLIGAGAQEGGVLAAAVLLARPPVARALDWEDFDLLRVAGRQAASYLAEDRAGRALAQAARFEEFNRRFAFILHDIKNLVSQQLLVARNAERHAANPAFRADMVATLKDSADRMTALLAKLSQAEPARAEPLQPVDCAALAARVARAWPDGHVRCETAPLWAAAHPQRLEQVLGHLVQNAIEASAPGAPVTIRTVADSDQVAITVTDHGGGMTPAFVRDELFRPFSSTKPGGFGLGAFEARQLVAAMDGTLGVESRAGEGTCFTVRLPRAPAMEVAA